MPRKIIAPSIAAVIAASMIIAVMPVAAARNIDTPTPAVTYPGRYVKAYTNRADAAPEAVPDNAHPSYAPPVGGSGNAQTDAAAQTDEFTAVLIDSPLH